MAVIIAFTRLGIESNRDWMACTNLDAHSASTQCHSSSNVVTCVYGRASRSATMNHTFSIGERSVPHTITAVMGQYDDDECLLPMYISPDAAKLGCDHLDAVNRTCIHQKKMTPHLSSAHIRL
ncbi:hypothetical protein TNCV_2985951 [Trichonephila clavipes]|nr:hypothetical protein TNCV_2985951 [Trichonephila clavipes]